MTKVHVVLDANGGKDALFGVFTVQAHADAHAAALSKDDSVGEFFVEEADLLDGPMFGEVPS